MKNVIFVVNANNALRNNSAESIEAAALRWKCDQLIINSSDCTLHPACWKTDALRSSSHHGWERVLILDADTVVSSRAPNPFDVPEHLMMVVSDRQTHNPARDKAEVDEWEIITGTRTVPARYFNSGMILAHVELHAALFKRAWDLAHDFPHLCWHDQTPFNVAAQGFDFVHYADDAWNFLNPVGRIPEWRSMTSKYVYHFAGNPDRHSQIGEVQWK